MIRKTNSSIPRHVCVIFELPASVWADCVCLTGDFNNWCKTSTPMKQGRDGVWRVALDLPAGQRFQFRYLIDGAWQTDWHSDGTEENEYGSHNSVVITELPELHTKVEHPQPGGLLREAGVEPPTHIYSSKRTRYPLPAAAQRGDVDAEQTRSAA